MLWGRVLAGVWVQYQVLEGVSCSECFLLIHGVCVGGRATAPQKWWGVNVCVCGGGGASGAPGESHGRDGGGDDNYPETEGGDRRGSSRFILAMLRPSACQLHREQTPLPHARFT